MVLLAKSSARVQYLTVSRNVEVARRPNVLAMSRERRESHVSSRRNQGAPFGGSIALILIEASP
jgi:hypothetical protein